MMGALGLIGTVLVVMFVAGFITLGVLVVTLGLCAAWMLLVGALMGDGEKPS